MTDYESVGRGFESLLAYHAGAEFALLRRLFILNFPEINQNREKREKINLFFQKAKKGVDFFVCMI